MTKIRQCMITSDLSHLPITTIKKVLNDNKELFKDWAYIIHDKDIYTQEEYDLDIKNNRKPKYNIGDTKYKHVHLILRLNNAYTFSAIAKKFNINANFVETIKGRFKDALKYLTHENALNKYQYSEDEVISNFNWLEEKKQLSYNERKKEIIDNIESGKYKRYNIEDYITIQEYLDNKSSIEKAFEYLRRKKERKLQKEARNMEVIFIQGSAGSGKTTYAKEIARQHNLDFYVSSGSNDVLDSYEEQPCLILDDLRPSCMGLSDLLKMLDNNTSSSVKSRYYNKTLFCDLVIITTTKDINTFFNEVFENEEEPREQLLRRCTTLIKMTDDYINVLSYDKKNKKYIDMGCFENDIIKKYSDDNLTQADRYKKVSDLLGLDNLTAIRKEDKEIEITKEEFNSIFPNQD